MGWEMQSCILHDVCVMSSNRCNHDGSKRWGTLNLQAHKQSQDGQRICGYDVKQEELCERSFTDHGLSPKGHGGRTEVADVDWGVSLILTERLPKAFAMWS